MIILSNLNDNLFKDLQKTSPVNKSIYFFSLISLFCMSYTALGIRLMNHIAPNTRT